MKIKRGVLLVGASAGVAGTASAIVWPHVQEVLLPAIPPTDDGWPAGLVRPTPSPPPTPTLEIIFSNFFRLTPSPPGPVCLPLRTFLRESYDSAALLASAVDTPMGTIAAWPLYEAARKKARAYQTANPTTPGVVCGVADWRERVAARLVVLYEATHPARVDLAALPPRQRGTATSHVFRKFRFSILDKPLDDHFELEHWPVTKEVGDS